jgi:hypothetical protein
MTNIINQIQASITGKATSKLDEYEENARERQKDTNMQDRTQTPPQIKS